ncbi:protein kinase [Roseomonas hellenica]|uniref:Protein kinase n=1 Tax=Plastoroseomonas hellenica TaxID=2687306 RepID=A0ABS5F5S7_9PROT|nr:serine/threonine-protein kinase [Plastoroseomonas hellenica]MBR0667897.1 protein kinase [Plastoroseomonas hellenica]
MLPAELAQKYEVRGTLGAGAMGTVLDAVDRIIERRVAIKVVKMPAANDPEGKEAHARFRREAQAAGRLSHANIVGVYDYGENAETAWIVMELVEGGSLKDRLDRQERFTVQDVARLMEQVLSALAYSHGRGVVHRDIKPGNIMLSSQGPDASVKIADFGIARLENSSMTQVGTLIGTPSYMAPEQFRGEPVDARADIWAAGVMLYQLLTGEKPFEGGFSAVMHKALNTEPPPPSELSVTVPRAFDAVIARALAKRPDERFASADAFAQAIRQALTAPSGAAPSAPLPLMMPDSDATLVATGGGAGTMGGLSGVGLPGLPGLDGTAATGTTASRPAFPPATEPKPAKPEGKRGAPLGLIFGGAGGLAAIAAAAWFFVLQPPPGPTPEELVRQAELARQAELVRQQEAQRIAAEAARQAELARQQEAQRQAEAARQEAERQAELTRLAEIARQQRLTEQEQARQQALFRQQEEARQAEAARQADAARQAAEAARQAELALQTAEAARLAELARQQEIARQQQDAARQAELARQHEAARQAELARQQEAARHAELARQAEVARQQEAARQAAELARQQEAERQRQAELERQRQLALVRPDFRSAAAAAVAAASCGLLTWTASDQSLSIAGVARRGEDAAIRRELTARNVPEDSARLALQLFDGPYCGTLDVFRPVLALGDSAPRVSVLGTMPLAKGQFVRLDVQMPDWPAYIHLAYFMNTGEAAQLVPSPLVPSTLQQPSARLRLGEPRGNFPGWEVDEPFGTDLAIVIASDRPLLASVTRPANERPEEYLAAIATAIRNNLRAGGRVIARPVVVETVRGR